MGIILKEHSRTHIHTDTHTHTHTSTRTQAHTHTYTHARSERAQTHIHTHTHKPGSELAMMVTVVHPSFIIRSTTDSSEKLSKKQAKNKCTKKADYYYHLLLASSQVNRSGSPQAFHKFKFRTQVEYNSKHAYYINVKHTDIIRKVVPSVSLS